MSEIRELLSKLRRLTNIIQRARSQEFSSHDVNMMDGKGRLLTVLKTKDGLTQRELSEALDIRPSSVGELLRKLEANDLVIRQNNDADRRVMNVYLTESGRKLIEDSPAVHTEIQVNVLNDISEEEKEVFTRVLTKMIISLEEKYPMHVVDGEDVRPGRKHCHHGKGRRNRMNDDDRMHRNQEGRCGLGRRKQMISK